MSEKVLVEVRDLCKYYKTKNGMLHAVEAVNFSIAEGTTLGVVGESGCGKSTLGRTVMNLHDATSGRILFDGEDVSRPNKAQKKMIHKNIQMIFQDRMSSLNERAKVGYIVSEGLYARGNKLTEAQRQEKAAKALEDVGLLPEFASRFPHEFSGGQRQRIGIARALVMDPKFIVADEPISALDVSIRAQVLNLMSHLQKERGLTYLFIAHDLSVVRFICNRIAVIHRGEIVELAESEELFRHPLHPYTQALLSAIPQPNPITEKNKQLIVYDSAMHDYASNPPSWAEILPGHFILANERELDTYRRGLDRESAA